MTTSLVTGGAGFIGSHVADCLIKMGHKVVILDDFSGTNSMENIIDFKFIPSNWAYWDEQLLSIAHVAIKGSITDWDLVNHVVACYKPDYIFHLAAYAAEGLSHHIRRFNYETNLVGSANLINAAVNYGVKRFVFTSSVAVYGLNAHYADEREIPTPIDPYGIAKYAVEQDLMAAQRMFGLKYTIFRPGNVYGPRQNLNDGYRNAVGIFMRQCLKDQPMTIFGTGEQRRQFTYIDDVAPHIANCVTTERTENQVINIGADESYNINHVAALVAKVTGMSYQTNDLPPRDEAREIRVDHTKSHYLFNIQAETPLPNGIQKMYEWAKSQELKDPRPFAGIEIAQNLPEQWRKMSI